MKVRCIAKGTWKWTRRKKDWLGNRKTKIINGPKYGDVVTVENEYWFEGQKYYRLVEWPDEQDGGWEAKQFVPIEPKFEKVEFEKITEKEPVSLN